MLDMFKLRTQSQNTINSLLSNPLLSNYEKKGLDCFKINDRIKLEFRPVYEDYKKIGYNYVDLIIFPHFIKNNYLHNGDDFSPIQCIEIIKDVFKKLNLEIDEINEFNLIKIEYGLNIILLQDIKTIIPQFIFYSKSSFIRNKANYSLISDTCKHKQVKVYAKGIDCLERLKVNGININTLRIELKSNQRRFIKLKPSDLLKLETYDKLMENILKEFDSIIMLEPNLDKKCLNKNEIKDLKKYLKINTWQEYKNSINRDLFNYNRNKYNKICAKSNSMKSEIKYLIKSKFNEWKYSAISSTQTY